MSITFVPLTFFSRAPQVNPHQHSLFIINSMENYTFNLIVYLHWRRPSLQRYIHTEKFIALAVKKDRKACHRIVSKAQKQNFYIFRHCTYIVYIQLLLFENILLYNSARQYWFHVKSKGKIYKFKLLQTGTS
jgi:hypothetical protein